MFFIKTLWLVLFFIIVKGNENDTENDNYKCNLVINEINPDVSTKLEEKEFIELKLVCAENAIPFTSLNYFKVIVIDHKINGQPIIYAIINLQSYELNENNFFTIGGRHVTEASLNIPSNDIMFRHYFETKQFSNLLPNCNDLPCAIVLLYDIKNLPTFKLSFNQHYLTINTDIKATIKSSLIDMLVYGRRAKSRRFDIYEFLKPEYINENYILRDFDAEFGKDLSINRCTVSTMPFIYDSFKLGAPTPSQDNDCSMSSSLIFEQNIIEIIPPIISIIQNDIPDSCQSEISPNVYESVQTGLVVDYVERNAKRQKLETCSTLLKDISANKDRSEMIIANNRISQMGFDINNEWETIKYFDPNWINFMQSKLPQKMPVKILKTNKQIQSWFLFKQNNQHPDQSSYLCRLCSKYYDLMLLNPNYRSNLANIYGIKVSDNYKQNLNYISKHFATSGHQAVIRELIKIDKEKVTETFNELQKIKEVSNEALAATARMIRTVYAELRANVPFSSHYIFADLQKTHGVELGYLYAIRKGARAISDCISDEMHSRLIKHIKNENKPFSMIVDTSEDIVKNHYLSVMIQAIEKTRPIVYFYKLIKLGSSESGFGIFTFFYNQLVEDGLVTDFKNNLVGFVSDGASVMTSEKVGFVSHVKKSFSNNIVAIHCMAHRLQLVAAHAMKKISYFSDFEGIINELHSFYFGHSHKRPIQLREMAEDLDLIMYKLDYIFQVRWLASEVKAIQKVEKMWLLLVSNLDKISKDFSERVATRNKASLIYKKITDKNFVSILHFMIDVLEFLNTFSLEFQKSGGVLIGKSYLFNKMVSGLTSLQINFGSNMLNLLSTCKCPNQASIKVPCTLEDFETNDVLWKDVKLVIDKAPLLSSIRNEFLETLHAEINSMFPDLDVKKFDIFLPNNIPRNPIDFEKYGKDELNEFLNFFKWDFTFELLHSDWVNLLTHMFENQDIWCSVENLPANIFWSEYLKLDIWTPRTLKLIYTVLVIPVGSSDVERSFSFLNDLKTRKRNRIIESTLDNLIRIKMNGPLEVSKFNAMDYAEVWIKKGRLPVDDKKRYVEKLDHHDNENPDFVYLDRSALF